MGKTGELLSRNIFTYCKNEPINMYEPSGYKGTTILGGFHKFFIGVMTAVAFLNYQITSVLNPALPMPTFATQERIKTKAEPS